MALDRVCQKANPWSWAFLRLIQFSASWNTFHLVLHCTFRGFVTSWYSSSWKSVIGLKAVKNTVCLPSFVSFPPAIWMDNRMHTERRTNVTQVLTPHVWNFHVTKQWRIYFVSSRATLDGTHVVDEAVRIQAILKSFSCRFLNADDLTTRDSSIPGRSRRRDIT